MRSTSYASFASSPYAPWASHTTGTTHSAPRPRSRRLSSYRQASSSRCSPCRSSPPLWSLPSSLSMPASTVPMLSTPTISFLLASSTRSPSLFVLGMIKGFEMSFTVGKRTSCSTQSSTGRMRLRPSSSDGVLSTLLSPMYRSLWQTSPLPSSMIPSRPGWLMNNHRPFQSGHYRLHQKCSHHRPLRRRRVMCPRSTGLLGSRAQALYKWS
mmetsp:Transcript_68972/g.136726  ORF Transcript_68972/g.136726 Transcript_68972/m.136726 type:complete len:211 (+) Transcript_68972:2662-3294(+)